MRRIALGLMLGSFACPAYTQTINGCANINRNVAGLVTIIRKSASEYMSARETMNRYPPLNSDGTANREHSAASGSARFSLDTLNASVEAIKDWIGDARRKNCDYAGRIDAIEQEVAAIHLQYSDQSKYPVPWDD